MTDFTVVWQSYKLLFVCQTVFCWLQLFHKEFGAIRCKYVIVQDIVFEIVIVLMKLEGGLIDIKSVQR